MKLDPIFRLHNKLSEKLLQKSFDSAGIGQADRCYFACVHLHDLICEQGEDLIPLMLRVCSDCPFPSSLQSQFCLFHKVVVESYDYIFR